MFDIPKESYADSRVEVRESLVAGKGSFAGEAIKKGETVIVWGGGVVVTNEEFEKGFREGKFRPETAMHYDADHKWTELALEDGAEDDSDPYINHSCDPNLWFEGGWPLVARRDIEKGEELTFDYATGETYPLNSRCQCGSDKCREYITGEEWKDVEFQKQHEGHFNPYIQGLINKEYKA